MPEPTRPTDVTRSEESLEETLAEISDDALAEIVHEYAEQAKRLSRLAHGAHAELQARMRERGGTVLETEHWSGKMKPGRIEHHVYNTDRFRQRLVPHVGTKDILAAFIEPPAPALRCDHRFLNDLRKRGGLVAQIIDEERQSVRGEDMLVLERKPTVDEERARQERKEATDVS